MLARSGLLPRRIPRCAYPRQPSNKRFFIQSLCDGFLDLAVALPFPPSVPAYSATIILVTVASRLVIFPVALWGRNGMRRMDDVVVPELERLKPIISREIMADLKRKGLATSASGAVTLQRIHQARTKEKLQVEIKRLLTEHKCHPILSMVVSPATQLPVFIVMTTVFSRLAQDPTPFDSEAFFTLTTLNHADPTWTIPIILGMVTMANVESNHWFLSSVQKDRLAQQGEKRAAVRSLLREGLNGLSLVRIIWAAYNPGSVALYWTTSAICGLIQTWVLDRLPAKNAPFVAIAGPKPSTPPLVSSTQKSLAPAAREGPAKKYKKKRSW
ncbi:60Kd inner membrane protein-domain-containing protein [Mycena maculata]|uniref:60Kd inner membrane protein-domain-containing protein n=1 Tax=Mycena maculata TaxID=230809 RepID=A0AAD7JHN3_9AGAR|nr:60Kd inner membrane protein-domain-containing protein [Mycena maculata]